LHGYGLYGGLKSQDVDFLKEIFAFSGEATLCGKMFKILFRTFHRDID